MVAPEFWYGSGAMGGFSSLQLPAAGACLPPAATPTFVLHWNGSAVDCTNKASGPTGTYVINAGEAGPMGAATGQFTSQFYYQSAAFTLDSESFPGSSSNTWTLAGWLKMAGGSGPDAVSATLISSYSNNARIIRYAGQAGVQWGIVDGANNAYTAVGSGFVFVSLGCDGTNLHAFVNGSPLFGGSPPAAQSVSSSASFLVDAPTSSGNEIFDQILFDPYQCLWTEAYTPPTTRFYTPA